MFPQITSLQQARVVEHIREVTSTAAQSPNVLAEQSV
jgi:hypothetical protein